MPERREQERLTGDGSIKLACAVILLLDATIPALCATERVFPGFSCTAFPSVSFDCLFFPSPSPGALPEVRLGAPGSRLNASRLK